MKKLFAVLLVVLLVAAPAAAAEKTLGLVISTLNNPFFVTLKQGAEEAATKAGVKLVVLDAQDDSAKMTAAMEDLIQQKVDAILVNPTDSDAVTPSIMKANAAGIPVLTIDRGASGGQVLCHVASDNVAGGVMAGEFLAKKLEGKGNVVELVGIPGTSAARDRGKGFNDAIATFKDIKVVASQAADFSRDKGLKVFENILQAQPEIAGVFAHNDEMILGAVADPLAAPASSSSASTRWTTPWPRSRRANSPRRSPSSLRSSARWASRRRSRTSAARSSPSSSPCPCSSSSNRLDNR